METGRLYRLYRLLLVCEHRIIRLTVKRRSENLGCKSMMEVKLLKFFSSFADGGKAEA